MKAFSKCIIKMFKVPGYLHDRLLAYFYKRAMKHCGKRVIIHPSSSVFYGLENLSLGDDVNIPKYAHVFCTKAPLTIGSKVIFGPAPVIVTGNHRTDKVGAFMYDVNDKLPENDRPVVIEDEVWCGANVTILAGVTIGRGSVIAAGAVVNRSCPPYSVMGGVPAQIIKKRFTPEEIILHEKALYGEVITALDKE